MTPKKTSEVPLLHVELDRAVLLKQLTKCARFVERKTTIPILSNFLLTAELDRMRITATDLETSITTGCSAKVKGEGSITVNARKLLDVLKKLATVPDMPDAVTIRELTGHWVTVSCGTFTVKLPGMASANYPVLSKIPGKKTTWIPSRCLGKMLEATRACISEEETRYTLNGGLLLVQGGVVRMLTTDGHRLSSIEADIPGVKDIRVLIAKNTIDLLRPFLSGKGVGADATIGIELGTGDNAAFVYFQLGELGEDLITARVMVGQFPNYEAVLPAPGANNKVITLDSNQLSKALGLVATFADERSHAVRFELIPGQGLKLSASSTEDGEASQMVPGEYQGLPIAIGFNAVYVLDWLRTVNGGGAKLKLRDEQSAGLWEPVEMEGYRFRTVVMPMRI